MLFLDSCFNVLESVYKTLLGFGGFSELIPPYDFSSLGYRGG